MKYILPILVTLLLAGFIYSQAIAENAHNHDHDHDHGHEEEIQHYTAEDVKTIAEAHVVLESKKQEIQEILEDKNLSVAALEEIHQISYTLEAATDRLIQDKAHAENMLAELDEAVQAIHYASEKHEAESVREWFTTLQAIDFQDDQESNDLGEASQSDTFHIVIKDHKFTPEEIRAPAGKKIKLVVDNQDPTPEEFESDDFRREKIIPGHTKANIFVGPLKPGKYHFFGEFNLATANGYLIVE